ncbi:hypothetical protein MIR68_001759 [Amoeboaphelidium protococcarum]|nr:hypothetical protein MIR68_001759 [Amoeboaphelidium protococcarum]
MKLPLLNVIDFYNATYRKGRVFAMDLGTKRIGLAVADFQQQVAFPVASILTPPPHMLSTVINSVLMQSVHNLTINDVSGYIIGEPLDFSGQQTRQSRVHLNYMLKCAQAVPKIEQLAVGRKPLDERLVGGPFQWKNVVMIDERFSTAIVRRNFKSQPQSQSMRHRYAVSKDTQSAVYILETYLEMIKQY